jgi:hypothetical protein
MKKIIFVALSFVSINLFAQEESFPCSNSNHTLLNLFNGFPIKKQYVHNCYGPGLGELASSFLKASGTPPEIIEDPEGMEPPEDTDYVNWTCKYSPGQIGDNDPTTAWVEGVEGYGIGEAIIIPCLDLKRPVEIWAGYGKSKNLHQYNSRPSKIRLTIIQSKPGNPTQYGTWYDDLFIIEDKLVELQDVNGYQVIELPKYQIEEYFDVDRDVKNEYKYFLGIEIIDVYKGTKWDDTCISEVRNVID